MEFESGTLHVERVVSGNSEASSDRRRSITVAMNSVSTGVLAVR